MGRRSKNEDVWPQRHIYVALLDQKLADGMTYPEIAKAVGLASSRSLEHEWRHDKLRMPGRQSMKRLAEIFGVTESALYGPTGAHALQPPEDPFQGLRGLSEFDRVSLRRIGVEFASLTTTQRIAVVEALSAMIRAIKS